MITILSLKAPSGKATDAVDTVNQNIFSRIDKSEVGFLESAGFLKKVRLLRKLKPEYILGIGNIDEILYLPFKPRKTKYIIGWHTLLKKTKTWLIRKTLFNASDFVIAVSECSADSVRKNFPFKNIVSVLNGVDLDFFNPEKADKSYLSEKYDIDFSLPTVLFVGAIYEGKRPDVFVEVSKKFKEANFILIGRKIKKDFHIQTEDLDNLKWIPYMDREDIATMMASSDIFLFPSVIDACPAVVPEALASGLPALLSDRCGNKELIEDGREGFLIEPKEGEIGEFVAHLKDLLTDSPDMLERMSGQARKRCLEELNWKAVSNKYKEIITSNL